MKTKNTLLTSILLLSVLLGGCKRDALQTDTINSDCYNFIIANDLGRNGFYDQKLIAASMGRWAENADIHFVIAAGDVHHFNGVASVNDPLWMTNYELIYNDPRLMLDWFPILGNHEYRGNTQACLDYGKVSRRWMMPARYYTQLQTIDDSTTLRLLYIDTTPLIDKYREESDIYPDACKQDEQRQLHFIDSVLTINKATWTVVIGHHPVYAYTLKDESERLDLQKRLDPLLRKHHVDFYFCGHIHNFQHIRKIGSNVEYVVNSSASLSRPVQKMIGTQFSSDLSGFTICSVDSAAFTIHFMNKNGESIYTYSRYKDTR
jgi:hypothetical protein